MSLVQDSAASLRPGSDQAYTRVRRHLYVENYVHILTVTLSGVLIYATAVNIARTEKMNAKENVSLGNRRESVSSVSTSAPSFKC